MIGKALCVLVAAFLVGLSGVAESQQGDAIAALCKGLPKAFELRQLLQQAAIADNPLLSPELTAGDGDVGGAFEGTRVWGAIVNRNGQLCAWEASTSDPTAVRPAGQALAMAKAYTANAFSTNITPAGGSVRSTAGNYTLTQPGQSLWGLNQLITFDPRFLLPPTDTTTGLGQIPGGFVSVGGGVPLFQGNKVIGGLGVGGDTSCADHEIAKRVRDLAGLNPPAGPLFDDISYSSVDGARLLTHPLCLNTFRNEVFIGNAPPASGY